MEKVRRISKNYLSAHKGISVGSLYELETQLIISKEIGIVTKDELNPILIEIDEINKNDNWSEKIFS